MIRAESSGAAESAFTPVVKQADFPRSTENIREDRCKLHVKEARAKKSSQHESAR